MVAYDTLTQMCRWFGYRDGYEDVSLYCSMSHGSIIARCHSIRELDDELKTMKLVGDFVSIWAKGPNKHTALITAKNKLGAQTLVVPTRASELTSRSRDNVNSVSM